MHLNFREGLLINIHLSSYKYISNPLQDLVGCGCRMCHCALCICYRAGVVLGHAGFRAGVSPCCDRDGCKLTICVMWKVAYLSFCYSDRNQTSLRTSTRLISSCHKQQSFSQSLGLPRFPASHTNFKLLLLNREGSKTASEPLVHIITLLSVLCFLNTFVHSFAPNGCRQL